MVQYLAQSKLKRRRHISNEVTETAPAQTCAMKHVNRGSSLEIVMRLTDD